MKKNLLILAAFFCAAFVVMYILVKGAEPDRLYTSFTRTYQQFKLVPIDTVPFPGRVSIMKTDRGKVYGYVYSKNSIYSYDLNKHQLDTLLRKKELPIDMVTRLEVDTTSNTFYLFDHTKNKAISWRPEKRQMDSLFFSAKSAVNADALPQHSFLTTGYDTVKKVLLLKLRNLSAPGNDTLLHQFPFFEDGGLSADGFFVRNAASRYHFYIPFYNGRMLRYDAQLKQVTPVATIDRTEAANVTVKSGKVYMRSSKSVMVNSAATADSEYLYVLSYVVSKDAKESGYYGPVVDVYGIANGNYAGSFKLPGFMNKPVLQMARYADQLIAVYQNHVLTFKLKTS